MKFPFFLIKSFSFICLSINLPQWHLSIIECPSTFKDFWEDFVIVRERKAFERFNTWKKMKLFKAHVQKNLYKWNVLEVKEFSWSWMKNCFGKILQNVVEKKVLRMNSKDWSWNFLLLMLACSFLEQGQCRKGNNFLDFKLFLWDFSQQFSIQLKADEDPSHTYKSCLDHMGKTVFHAMKFTPPNDDVCKWCYCDDGQAEVSWTFSLLFHLINFINFLRLVKVFGVNLQGVNISQSARSAATSNASTTNLSSSFWIFSHFLLF